jgi:hypothetical protein
MTELDQEFAVDYRQFVAPGLCACCGRQETLWTPERIVEAMRRWAHQHGRPPTSHAWHRAGQGHPSAQRVITVFGSFKRAQAAAGLRTVRSSTGVAWGKHAIIHAIFQWRFEHGRAPRAEDWRGQIADRLAQQSLLADGAAA